MASPEASAHSHQALLTVELPSAAFSVEAVHRATYALMAKIDVRIVRVDPIVCELAPLSSKLTASEADILFRREVTDQELRIAIEQQTSAYRDVILGLAFSKTGLQDG